MEMVNLTQHTPSESQLKAGVVSSQLGSIDLHSELTFTTPPTEADMEERASRIVGAVVKCHPAATAALVGGAPYFMPYLCEALREEGIIPYYSFTQRVVKEDGSVKTSVFEHLAFITAK